MLVVNKLRTASFRAILAPVTAELLVPLGAFFIACAALVVALLALRNRPVTPDQPDVDELALELARLQKQLRRDRMSRVRAGESGPEGATMAGPPPELRPLDETPLDSKAELRRRAYGLRRP